MHWHIPVTRASNFLATQLLKYHRMHPAVLVREEIRWPSISNRDFDRSMVGFSGDVRCWNFWKYSEHQTKRELSCPRQSVGCCFKALTFSIFKTGVELHGRIRPIMCASAFVRLLRTPGLICQIANSKKLEMIKKSPMYWRWYVWFFDAIHINNITIWNWKYGKFIWPAIILSWIALRCFQGG